MSAQPHSKLCQCQPCVTRRYDRFLEALEGFEAKNHVRPVNPDQTVMVKRYSVRAHFRRNPHHLQSDEGLRGLVHKYFSNVTRPITVRRPGAKGEGDT